MKFECWKSQNWIQNKLWIKLMYAIRTRHILLCDMFYWINRCHNHVLWWNDTTTSVYTTNIYPSVPLINFRRCVNVPGTESYSYHAFLLHYTKTYSFCMKHILLCEYHAFTVTMHCLSIRYCEMVSSANKLFFHV